MVRRFPVAVALATLALATACTSSDPARGSSADSPTGATESPCASDYTPDVLPSWASGGFTDPDAPVPHVLGDHGEMVAIVWAEHDPLVVPPREDRNNKILWVAKETPKPGGALHITATLEGTDRTETRTVDGGPGPSIVDLPVPGCWSFDLAWGDHTDHLELAYAAS